MEHRLKQNNYEQYSIVCIICRRFGFYLGSTRKKLNVQIQSVRDIITKVIKKLIKIQYLLLNF